MIRAIRPRLRARENESRVLGPAVLIQRVDHEHVVWADARAARRP